MENVRTLRWIFRSPFLLERRTYQFSSRVLRPHSTTNRNNRDWSSTVTVTRSYIFKWRFRCRCRRRCISSLMLWTMTDILLNISVTSPIFWGQLKRTFRFTLFLKLGGFNLFLTLAKSSSFDDKLCKRQMFTELTYFSMRLKQTESQRTC